MRDSITTERLTLRTWRDSDHAPFRALNRDARVMEYFPALLANEETDAAIGRIEKHFERHGFGLFAVELNQTKAFIGFIGLNIPSFDAPFMPAVEIGWRLAHAAWGRGLATEGAHAVVRHALETLEIAELVSFTTAANLRSRRVMEKIGMVRDEAADFEHPDIPAGHPLRPHVLYRMDARAYARNERGG